MNSKGQGLVILITFLPVMLSLILLTRQTYKILLQKSRTSHICREGLLKYQKIQKDGLTQLLRLNPLATQLRLKRKSVDKAYRAAIRLGQPKAIAVALFLKLKVIAEQKALAAKQKLILDKTYSSAFFILQNTQSNITKNLKKKIIPKIKGKIHLQVYPSPPKSDSPNYITRTHFTKKQNLQIKWNIDSFLNIPMLRKPIQLNCGASLIKENLKWIAVLSEMDKL